MLARTKRELLDMCFLLPVKLLAKLQRRATKKQLFAALRWSTARGFVLQLPARRRHLEVVHEFKKKTELDGRACWQNQFLLQPWVFHATSQGR